MPIGLTNNELIAMRRAINDLLPGTCNILSLTRTSDGQGGWTEAWGTATTGVSCRLDNVTKREQLSGAAVQHFTGWVLTVPYDTTITQSQRVEIGSTQYNVRGIDSGKSWTASLRLDVEAV